MREFRRSWVDVDLDTAPEPDAARSSSAAQITVEPSVTCGDMCACAVSPPEDIRAPRPMITEPDGGAVKVSVSAVTVVEASAAV